MTTFAVHFGTACISFALSDEWGGITPALADSSGSRESFTVPRMHASQGGFTCLGANAEAMVMAGSGPSIRFRSWREANDDAVLGAMLRGAHAELQRRRARPDRILIASSDEADAVLPQYELMAVRSAGFEKASLIPRAVAIAADTVIAADGRATLVVQVRSDEVVVLEVCSDGSDVRHRTLACYQGLGWRSLLDELLGQVEPALRTAGLGDAEVFCEAMRTLRQALNPRRGEGEARIVISPMGPLVHLLSPLAAAAALARWRDGVVALAHSNLSGQARAWIWVEDCGLADLATPLAEALGAASGCRCAVGPDPALGAARLAGSDLDLAALGAGYRQASQWSDASYGVLRPTADGKTEFRPLGKLLDLRSPQLLALRTTREDQLRIVLPIAVQKESSSPPETLAMLEFALAAPARKGVQVDFYLELDGPLIRVRGVASGDASPVGEAFVPLSSAVSERAASLRAAIKAAATP